MERREYFLSKKFYLKGLAKQIRELKAEFKQLEREKKDSWNKRCEVIKAKYEYRHQHIAYSIARGRTYDQVENKVRENNEPNEDYIKQLLEEYPTVSEMDNETALCVDSE